MDSSGLQLRFSMRHLAILFVAAAVILTWYRRPEGSAPTKTGRELDVAIFGHGWFQVAVSSGETFYTKKGRLSINANGNLILGKSKDGIFVDPPINIPESWRSIHISPSGIVTVENGNFVSPTTAGMLQLARFMNPQGLKEELPGFYSETTNSGRALIGQPGSAGFGFVKQGWLQTTDSPFDVSLQDLLLLALLCLTGWTLFEVKKLKQEIVDRASNTDNPSQ